MRERERERECSGDSEPARITCFPIQRLFLKDISKERNTPGKRQAAWTELGQAEVWLRFTASVMSRRQTGQAFIYFRSDSQVFCPLKSSYRRPRRPSEASRVSRDGNKAQLDCLLYFHWDMRAEGLNFRGIELYPPPEDRVVWPDRLPLAPPSRGERLHCSQCVRQAMTHWLLPPVNCSPPVLENKRVE